MTISRDVKEAIRLLSLGEVVALPTETVYGLAADGTSDEAVAKIYALKNRPCFNPLILHCHDLDQVKTLARVPYEAKQLAEQFWPGPLTLILERRPENPLSLLATAGLNTVAVRVPAHPIMQEVLQALEFPLAAPSANPSTQLSPTTAEHVDAAFKDRLGPALILQGGACEIGLESTILDLTESIPMILRPGAITREMFEICLGTAVLDFTSEVSKKPKAPGQLLKHYAPRLPLRLNVTEPQKGEIFLGFGEIAFEGRGLNLSPRGDLVEAAAHLFAYLHALDNPNLFQGIAVAPIPRHGLGLAINDRLERAAGSQ